MIVTQYDDQNFQLYNYFGVNESTRLTIVSNSALLEEARAHADGVGGRVVLGQSVPRARDQVE